MPRISEDSHICTVIVTVDAEPELLSTLEAHARMGLRRFLESSGFLGGALHVSSDGGRLVQYLQWASEAEYLACVNDPVWDDVPSTQSFLEAVDSGRARLDARLYRVITSSEGQA